MWSNSTGDVDRKIDRCGLTVQVWSNSTGDVG